mmetsp:Transcript_7180/g.18379  ORF Transcript_7180/g.18379 Transcript_7180/m.18379 type:complete len:128 (+) Transcript_7180:1411-1794(+)
MHFSRMASRRADSDTWQLCPSPHTRCSHGMSAHMRTDERSAELIVFGGFDGGRICQSTLALRLELAGADRCEVQWEDVSEAVIGAPRARIGHAQACTDQTTYVYGGGAEDTSCLGDTFRLTPLPLQT